MTTAVLSPKDQKIQSTAQELLNQGYKVITNPDIDDLPFSLGHYTPSLIARSKSDGIVLEVQTSLKRLSVDRLQSITEQVADHEGWRFLLVTLDDIKDSVFPSEIQELPTWEELETRLTQLEQLLEAALLEPALLFFWSLLEAALRRRSLQQHLPIQRFPGQRLLNHAYSSGEIALTEFDLFKDSLVLRNKVAHGIKASLDAQLLQESSKALAHLIQIWCSESDNR